MIRTYVDSLNSEDFREFVVCNMNKNVLEWGKIAQKFVLRVKINIYFFRSCKVNFNEQIIKNIFFSFFFLSGIN